MSTERILDLLRREKLPSPKTIVERTLIKHKIVSVLNVIIVALKMDRYNIYPLGGNFPFLNTFQALHDSYIIPYQFAITYEQCVDTSHVH